MNVNRRSMLSRLVIPVFAALAFSGKAHAMVMYSYVGNEFDTTFNSAELYSGSRIMGYFSLDAALEPDQSFSLNTSTETPGLLDWAFSVNEGTETITFDSGNAELQTLEFAVSTDGSYLWDIDAWGDAGTTTAFIGTSSKGPYYDEANGGSSCPAKPCGAYVGYAGFAPGEWTVETVLGASEKSDESPVSVPEPSTLLLFGAGIAALGLTRRRALA
jgi:hypothetical protein